LRRDSASKGSGAIALVVMAAPKQPFDMQRLAIVGTVAPLMERINAAMCDLEKDVYGAALVHPEFRGRTSIKAVLPVELISNRCMMYC
jgi:hypothetical protein